MCCVAYRRGILRGTTLGTLITATHRLVYCTSTELAFSELDIEKTKGEPCSRTA